MDAFFKQASQVASSAFSADQNRVDGDGDRAGAGGFQLPEFVQREIDKYLEGMKSEMHPKVVREIEGFQTMTCDALEVKVTEVFEKLFAGDFSVLAPPQQQQPPQQAQDRGISDFLTSVQNFAEDAKENFEEFAEDTKDVIRQMDPREKAREVIPRLREQYANIMKQAHTGLADKFCDGAIGEIRKFLRMNVSSREVGEGAAGDIAGMASGLVGMFSGGNGAENTRAAGDNQATGLRGLFSEKILGGVKDIRAASRSTLHTMLITIEQAAWQELPAHIRGPLEKVFGGFPLEGSGSGATPAPTETSRGFMDHLQNPIDKIRDLVEKLQTGIQNTLRGVVASGHLDFENKAVRHFEEVLMGRVRKVLPNATLE